MNQEHKPIKKAVAVQYDPALADAPLVRAKGEGMVAERIIDLANEHRIPIYEDPSLVELLCKIELNEQIPEELYSVMAEVLAMVYELDKKMKETYSLNADKTQSKQKGPSKQ